MLTAGNKQFPLQSWPLAYWPDGSIKWNGFATVVPAGFSGPATLSMNLAELQGPGLTPYSPVTVKNDGESLVVDTGAMQCSIPLSGAKILNSIGMGGKSIAGAAQLVCILQHGPSTDENAAPAREKFTSAIQHVTVEQPGGVRAVVKIEGMHRGAVSKREWMPFVVRLYFYSGQSEIRLVHSIVFDGDQEKDFVRGLGLEFDVPLRDEPRNRTVRFAGPDGGMWSEPLQPGGGSIAQETGQNFSGNLIFLKNAIWDSFKLIQPNAGRLYDRQAHESRKHLGLSRRRKTRLGTASLPAMSAAGLRSAWGKLLAVLENRRRSRSATARGTGRGRSGCLDVVAGRSRNGHAPLRHPAPRPGGRVRGRSGAKYEHRHRRGAHQRTEMIFATAGVPSKEELGEDGPETRLGHGAAGDRLHAEGLQHERREPRRLGGSRTGQVRPRRGARLRTGSPPPSTST